MLKHCLGGLLFSAVLFAQSSTITGAGYTSPAPVSVAPGQILTLFVDGLGLSPNALPVRAGSGPLPTSLGGVSVKLTQTNVSTPVPILAVGPVTTCPNTVLEVAALPCGGLIAVTVQIPYELRPVCPLCESPVSIYPTQLIVSANGNDSAPIDLNPFADAIHILTGCDIAVMPTQLAFPQTLTPGLPCSPMVTHADGSLVTASSPAAIGEGLTAWAVGLGQTNPPAATGQVVSSPAPVVESLSMDFNYTVNALPVKPFTGRPDVKPPQAPYAGIVVESVGLYQINFIVPPQPAIGTPRCALSGSVAPGANAVQSNLTVSFGGAFTFDGAGICVATQIPVD